MFFLIFYLIYVKDKVIRLYIYTILFIAVTLTKITDYKALIFQISEAQYETILQTKVDKATTWEFTYAFKELDTGEVPYGTRWYCKVNLDRFDKAIVEKKFNPFLKQVVNISVDITCWTPKPTADVLSPEPLAYFLLKNITKAHKKAFVAEELKK